MIGGLMAEAPAKVVAGLVEVSGWVLDHEKQAHEARVLRDDFFLRLYNDRAMTVTEMARISGIRRESVHEAINKARERNGG
jgi:hypothetical protein